jgi:hypothetical protein
LALLGAQKLPPTALVGSMKSVPENFLVCAEEAAAKRYHVKLFREMGSGSSQIEWVWLLWNDGPGGGI